MKTVALIFSAILSIGICKASTNPTPKKHILIHTAAKSIYSFKLPSIDGRMIDLSKYKGKKILIVNTASKCGYTPQYGKLQSLHQKMGDKLIILGFPANNFNSQEPGNNKEISEFCTKNYGVTFQMFEKLSVLGPDQSPLYKWLTTKSENGWNDKVPTWNFCKYLINEKGVLTNFWESSVDPTGPEIAAALAK